MTEIEALMYLLHTPSLGPLKARRLIEHFSSLEALFNSTEGEIQALPGFERLFFHKEREKNSPQIEKELSIADKNGISLIPYTSPLYPKSLKMIDDYPLILYVKGSLKPQDQRSIAIVGTRQASIYGNEMGEAFGKDLASQGYTVISGLARGIDTAAHRGALMSGRTIGVIGSGLCNIYPIENKKLADEISHQGAIISEFPLMTPPDRQNFPQRNRIVAAMAQGILLIEAPTKSGAMLTMERGRKYGKKLFAIPGRIDQENYKGNHRLLKSGEAYLVENTQDIFERLGDGYLPIETKVLDRQRHMVDNEEIALWKAFPEEEVGIDYLSSRVNLPIQQIQRVLMSLILKKMVKEFPGKIYKKLRGA